jgi:hypothetical protein
LRAPSAIKSECDRTCKSWRTMSARKGAPSHDRIRSLTMRSKPARTIARYSSADKYLSALRSHGSALSSRDSAPLRFREWRYRLCARVHTFGSRMIRISNDWTIELFDHRTIEPSTSAMPPSPTHASCSSGHTPCGPARHAARRTRASAGRTAWGPARGRRTYGPHGDVV